MTLEYNDPACNDSGYNDSVIVIIIITVSFTDLSTLSSLKMLPYIFYAGIKTAADHLVLILVA